MQLSVPIIIIIITAAISYLSFSNNELLYKLLLWPYRIKRNRVEVYRMMTSGFVHSDTTHLAVNMLTFYFLGDAIVSIIGPMHLVILYCSAIIVANIPSVIKNKNDYNSKALGASGGVAAVVFAYIYIAPWTNLYFFFILPIPAIIFALLYVIYSYKMRDKDPTIGHEAHLWGALYGFVYMALAIDPTHGLYFIENIKAIPYFN